MRTPTLLTVVLAAGNRAAEARCLLGLASQQLRTGDTEGAAPALDQALGAARAAGDRLLQGRVLNNIGLLHSALGEHDKALENFRQAITVREGIPYGRGLLVNHHNIGDAHFNRSEWSRAWVAFSASRKIAEDMGWERGMALNDTYMGYIETLRNRRSEGRLRMRKAIEIARRVSDPEIETFGLWLLARSHADDHDEEMARALLEQAATAAEGIQMVQMMDSIESMRARLRR